MKIGFVVNDVATEQPEYTTTRLALAAKAGARDLAHGRRRLLPRARRLGRRTPAPAGASTSRPRAYLETSRADERSSELDQRRRARRARDAQRPGRRRRRSAPWAVTSGVLFGQLIAASGVLVVNDPASLANAVNKTYFQHFPEAVRPRTLISRDEARSPTSSTTWAAPCSSRCRARAAAACSSCPSDESPNLNQMIEAIARDGYVVAQESCPRPTRATSACS